MLSEYYVEPWLAENQYLCQVLQDHYLNQKLCIEALLPS